MEHRGWYARGYLPHFDSANAVQFVTFRLQDSLPQAVLQDIAAKTESPSARREALERALDACAGSCLLSDPRAAQIMQASLLHFHEQRYRLFAWCVMPNHVHVLFQPLGAHCLADILHSWKSFSAKRINAMHDRKGRLWQPEYFDRFIRDERHFAAVVTYVEENPVAAGLVERAAQWRWSSAWPGA